MSGGRCGGLGSRNRRPLPSFSCVSAKFISLQKFLNTNLISFKFQLLPLGMRDGVRERNNIFDEMDALHIAKVFEELALRFGFPEKKWKEEWKAHLNKQPRNQDEVESVSQVWS